MRVKNLKEKNLEVGFIKNCETVMEVCKENIFHNLEVIEKFSGKKILPVLKGNAYGHCICSVANILYSGGYKTYCVSRIDEAKKILHNLDKDDVEILVFESIHEISDFVQDKRLIFSANSLEILKKALHLGVPPSRIKIKIDLGFFRNGITVSNCDELKRIIQSTTDNFYGIYSHLFSVSKSEVQKYIKTFEEVLYFLGRGRFLTVDVQNSQGIVDCFSTEVTHVRPGNMIYGLQSHLYGLNLKSCFSLIGKIEDIVSLQDGQKYLGYMELTEKTPLRLGKIKLGFADGFLKSNEKSICKIGDNFFEIIHVMMDYTFIKIDEDVTLGDSVEFYHDNISLEKNGMTPSQHLVLINDRVRRIIVYS